MKIAIIDDDKNFLNNFENALKHYINKYFQQYSIEKFHNNYSNIFLKKYDLIFIDIDLNGKNGIDLAANIKKECLKTIIIFISSKNNLVFYALSVQPFHFIRKNNLTEDLLVVLKLLYQYYTKNKYFITIEYHGRKTKININDIIYIESEGHYINILTVDDCYRYRSTMKNILTKINCNYFVQIQKSIIINFNYVIELDENNIFYLKNGNNFNLNRYYKKMVLEKYKEYLLL